MHASTKYYSETLLKSTPKIDSLLKCTSLRIHDVFSYVVKVEISDYVLITYVGFPPFLCVSFFLKSIAEEVRARF